MNCNYDHHETFCAVCVPSLHGAKRATPKHEQLIDELRDSTVPQTEREHAAAREIEKNQDGIAAGHRLALELECLLLTAKTTVSRWMDTARTRRWMHGKSCFRTTGRGSRLMTITQR